MAMPVPRVTNIHKDMWYTFHKKLEDITNTKRYIQQRIKKTLRTEK